jgi:hypothetical protein
VPSRLMASEIFVSAVSRFTSALRIGYAPEFWRSV